MAEEKTKNRTNTWFKDNKQETDMFARKKIRCVIDPNTADYPSPQNVGS